jgi:S1-C subfamily serine protease
MRRKLFILLIVLASLLLVVTGAIAGILIAGDGDDGPATADGARGFLGLTVSPAGPSQGLRVASVAPGGPADDAGLRVGDIVRSVDGLVVRTPEQLRTAVESRRPGARVSITYERGDREERAEVHFADSLFLFS